MSDNQIKENELRKVTGGAGERPTGFEKAKYDIGYSYDSGTLGTGIPNHHIIITVTFLNSFSFIWLSDILFSFTQIYTNTYIISILNKLLIILFFINRR